jgi:DDE superfamily endonuclease
MRFHKKQTLSRHRIKDSSAFPAQDIRPECPPVPNSSLGPGDLVISADEKTSIQARRRIHASLPPGPDRPMRIESEYERKGAWAYLAAWDVRRAKIFGRFERTTGIAPFRRLVAQVMRQHPYRSANRVFWITDNGSSHRGAQSDERLTTRWPTLIPVHTPVHASWLNEVEIYFSILQRKALTPNDFPTLNRLKRRLLAFQTHYESIARPFQWQFNRRTSLNCWSRSSAPIRHPRSEPQTIKIRHRTFGLEH